jgi:pimeloyl-ACP methyl ester carboxylesterase
VPLRDLILVGHSMGGLVIRSACASGEALGHAWPRALRALVFLGTPHHGAPLERGGHAVDMLFGASPYTVAFARLGQIRSAGIIDLRHGSVFDPDWRARVPALAIAGSLGRAAPARGGKPRGDGLVPVASALGIDTADQWIAYGTGHLDLLGSRLVYERMKDWLGAAAAAHRSR